MEEGDEAFFRAMFDDAHYEDGGSDDEDLSYDELYKHLEE